MGAASSIESIYDMPEPVPAPEPASVPLCAHPDFTPELAIALTPYDARDDLTEDQLAGLFYLAPRMQLQLKALAKREGCFYSQYRITTRDELGSGYDLLPGISPGVMSPFGRKVWKLTGEQEDDIREFRREFSKKYRHLEVPYSEPQHAVVWSLEPGRRKATDEQYRLWMSKVPYFICIVWEIMLDFYDEGLMDPNSDLWLMNAIIGVDRAGAESLRTSLDDLVYVCQHVSKMLKLICEAAQHAQWLLSQPAPNR